MKSLSALCATLIFAAAASLPCCGADTTVKSKAKEVLDKNKDAIVSVKMVISTRYVYSGRETQKSERKTEVVGTVVDPSGLVVMSNTGIDPYGGMDYSYVSGGENVQIKPETHVGEVIIVTADGVEIPAEFALKDADLDLAFVRPKDKLEKPLPAITFAKTADPDVLEDVIVIGRLGRTLNRVNSLNLGSIQAVIHKPRTLYVTDASNTGLGCPVFNSKGETLGLSVLRKSPVKDQNMWASQRQVVLPSEDLMEVAKQALTAGKEDEAKKEETATK